MSTCYAKRVILERLKSVTHGAHASLEQRMRIARPRPTLTDYRSYLRGMYGFTRPLEERFAQLSSESLHAFELAKRNKAHLLERDIDALDRRLGPSTRPLCPELPPTGTEASALGVLYVLEGSTLGARYLLRHLGDVGIDDASAYLRSYGDDLGAMWQRLRHALSVHHGEHPDEEGEMLSAAGRTFELLDVWLVAAGAADAIEAA